MADGYHHGHLVESAIETATLEIDERGVDNFSLRSLARRLGVSSAALYRHFADRESLLEGVAAQGYRELGELLETSVNWAVRPRNGREAKHRLQTLLNHLFEFVSKRPGLFRFMLTRSDGAMQSSPTGGDVVATYLKRAIEDVSARDRKVPVPSEDDLIAIHSLVDGMALRVCTRMSKEQTGAVESRPSSPWSADRLLRLLG